MLSGDLRTLPLADLLQWADSSRTRGLLTIGRPSGAVWMHIVERAVVACVKPLSQSTMLPNLGGEVELAASAVATEMLFDQFLDSDDRFRFEPDATPRDPGVTLDL
ncbi:MAG TPA: DUF4388 domain-containing protein, partial [Polyangiales bacterium]|nr:DUF4388 domain-containing protein [Polyangiales bacterium]